MTEIILGPPGTGKTTTLINLVEQELQRGVPPDRIGYFSFTKKAASEATSRAQEKFKLTKKDFPFFSTLHSMCYHQLSMKTGDVLEGARLQEFAKYAGVRISGRFSEDGTMVGFDVGDRIMFMENLARIRRIPLREQYDHDDDGLPWSEVDRVSRALREFKRDKGLRDYTDMLTECLDFGVTLGLEVLLIDESQDLSLTQWALVNQLANGCRRVAVAGDDDQAIYRWAGADVDTLIDMDGKERVLGKSWRVPPAIQEVANSIIAPVKHRRNKTWQPRAGGEGEVGEVNHFSNVDLREGSTLVLARNSYVIREQVEPLLRQQGIVWERHGRSSINLRLIDGIRAWEKIRRGETIEIAQARAMYEWMSSGRGVARGHKTIPNVPDEQMVTEKELRKNHGLVAPTAPWYTSLDRVPQNDIRYIRAALARGEKISEKPRITLSTIHGAKGGEADHVVLMREMASRTYNEMLNSNGDDERRVWYVGATRARERLTLVESTTQRRCPWL